MLAENNPHARASTPSHCLPFPRSPGPQECYLVCGGKKYFPKQGVGTEKETEGSFFDFICVWDKGGYGSIRPRERLCQDLEDMPWP